MKTGIKEVIFILDMSGSMEPLQQSTINGFNEMLQEQKQYEGQCLVTTVLFNHDINTVYSRFPISEVSPLSEREYDPFGTTALLDAVGETITMIRQKQMEDAEVLSPEKTLLIITTDGEENSSVEFNLDSVRSMISWLQKNNNWEVIYMGSALSSEHYANDLGIKSDRFVSWNATPQGNIKRQRSMTKKLKDFLD